MLKLVYTLQLSPNDVRKKTIVFQVYDKDTFGKDDGIGEIQIPLWQVDLDIETDNTMELSAVTKGKDNKPVLIARYESVYRSQLRFERHTSVHRYASVSLVFTKSKLLPC